MPKFSLDLETEKCYYKSIKENGKIAPGSDEMKKNEQKLSTNTYYDWIGLTFFKSRPRRFSVDAGLCDFVYILAPGSANFFDPGAKHPSNPRYDWGENGVSCGIPDPMKGIETVLLG